MLQQLQLQLQLQRTHALSKVAAMLSYLSQRLSDGLAATDAGGGAGAGGAGGASGVCPVSPDGRLVVCGFPGGSGVKLPNTEGGKSLPCVPAGELVRELRAAHGQGARFTVWNLSGERYDYGPLEDNVVEYALGVHPAPPLLLLVQLVEDVVHWLAQDRSLHVAVVHDLSGRRSAVVAACVLFRMLRDGLAVEQPDPGVSAATVLATIRERLGATGRALVPSQERYVEYYARLHDEELELGRPLRLTRVIVNGVPDFVNSGEERPGDARPVRCRPFCKIFVGQATAGGCAPPEGEFAPEDLCFSLRPESPFPRPGAAAAGPAAPPAGRPGIALNGDALLRCYHQSGAQAVPMFAVAFHTAFVRNGVLRVQAPEVDGAKDNGRFPRAFFVDLIFDSAEGLVAPPPQPAALPAPDEAEKQPSAVFKRLISAPEHSILDDEQHQEALDAERRRRDSAGAQQAPHPALAPAPAPASAAAPGAPSTPQSSGREDEFDITQLGEGLDESFERELALYDILKSDTETPRGAQKRSVAAVDAETGADDADDDKAVSAAVAAAADHDGSGGDDEDEGDEEEFDIDAFASSLDINLSSPVNSPVPSPTRRAKASPTRASPRAAPPPADGAASK